ncbi:MAG TPA: hypothetical protein VHA52_07910, partial [Candidatus Babeliaceae bacterium]|nr:hypothetical protein [Candidatus Babeliaceae bacterium]
SDTFINQGEVSSQLYDLMAKIGEFFKQTETIYKLINNNKDIVQAIPHFRDLEKIVTCSDELSYQMQAFIKDIKFFNDLPNIGRARSCYASFLAIKDQFVRLLKAIGELDALVSVAHLITKDGTNSCCYTEFIDAEYPYLELNNVWNPLITAITQEKESISFGDEKIAVCPNMLLSGPHGSGKSSFMREVAYSVITSQLFGVAFADSCRMTYFSVINTYFTVVDSIVEGKSTFMVSQELMDTIENRILNLKDKRYGLTLIDEPLRDTFEEEASGLIIKFGESIAPVTENICILATHYTAPIDTLELGYGDRFKNYHMKIEERTKGRFRRLFKLAEGKASWWFTDDAQRDRYIRWLHTAAS